uniref:Nucleoside diphosphate kinase-like domain-containing protein n=1 Tax=Parascaris equorum TaxID=6256 RepID=A0A914RN95_PAREQ
MVSMTFAMIKPEAVAFPHVAMAIFRRISSGGLEVVGAKRIQLSANDAKELYGIHRDLMRQICKRLLQINSFMSASFDT